MGARSSCTAPAAPAPFDALDDAVLGGILARLGPEGAWRARLVCRRFRAAVEGSAWPWPALRVRAARAEQLDALDAILRQRRLRLSGGAALHLVLAPAPRDGAPSFSDSEAAPAALSRAAARLVGAAAADAGLGFASARVASEDLEREAARAGAALGLGLGLCPSAALCRLQRERVEAVLAAVSSAFSAASASAPASGASGLADLTFAFAPAIWAELSPPSVLAALRGQQLGPILERFDASGWGVFDAPGCAALSASLPRLQSLAINLDDWSALYGLAALARLQELRCVARRPGVLGDGLAALAAGPAGRSLRLLACRHMDGGAVPCGPEAPAALAAMGDLEPSPRVKELARPAQKEGAPLGPRGPPRCTRRRAAPAWEGARRRRHPGAKRLQMAYGRLPFPSGVPPEEEADMGCKSLAERISGSLKTTSPTPSLSPAPEHRVTEIRTISEGEGGGTLVAVDFYVSWCRKCKYTTPKLAKASGQHRRRGSAPFIIVAGHGRLRA
eukprot:tig00020801_g13984.t1